MATRKYKSIFEEINNYVPNHSKEDLIESKGEHVITSAINLLALIRETYDEEEAEQIEKRLLSSIRGKDPRRYSRAVKKIRESKNASE